MKASKFKLFFKRKRIDEEESLDDLKVKSGLVDGEAENKFEPQEGMVCHTKDEDKDYQFDGEEWKEVNKKKFFLIWLFICLGVVTALLLAIILPIALSNGGSGEGPGSEPETSEPQSGEPTSTESSEEGHNVTVTFNTLGGSPIEKVVIEKGEKVTAPDDPTNGDLLFGGWYLEDKPKVNNYFDFDTALNNSITLYAQWVQPYVYNLEEDYTDQHPYYTVSDNSEYRVENVVVPGVYHGKPVEEIEPEFCETHQTVKTLTIEEGIKRIYYCAFYECTALESVSLPNTLKYIDEEAFRYFYPEFLHIPASVEVIGSAVFNECNNLKELTFDNSLTKLEISEYAFQYSLNLEELNLPEGLTNIGDNAFYQTSLKTVFLPSTLEDVDRDAFKINAITKIYSKTSKYNVSFYDDNNILKITPWYLYAEGGVLPEGKNGNFWYLNGEGSVVETTVDSNPITISFDSKGGTAASSINLNYGDAITLPTSSKDGFVFDSWYLVSENGKKVFFKDGDIIENSLTLSAHWVDAQLDYNDSYYMGNRVEGHTSSVENVIIPTYYHGESMYSVGAHAFEDCATLKSFTLEEGEISCFESGSFVNCTNLEYIVLEGNVRYIYGSAFAGCISLEKIYTKVAQETRIYDNNDAYKNATRFMFTENGDAETESGNWWYYDASHNIVEVINA